MRPRGDGSAAAASHTLRASAAEAPVTISTISQPAPAIVDAITARRPRAAAPRLRGPLRPAPLVAGAPGAPPLCGNDTDAVMSCRITAYLLRGSAPDPGSSLAGAPSPRAARRGRAVRAAVMRQRHRRCDELPHNSLFTPGLRPGPRLLACGGPFAPRRSARARRARRRYAATTPTL